MGAVPIWLVVVMGISTVFVCLVALIFIIKIYTSIIKAFVKTPEQKPTVATPQPAVATASPTNVAPVANKNQLLAVIGAAIAEDLKTDVSRLKIHSISQISGGAPTSKQALVAAIGSAIATDMGTDVSHVKIHSIRKI